MSEYFSEEGSLFDHGDTDHDRDNYWRKCSQCKRENSQVSWEKNNGKCPNCDDLFDRENLFDGNL